MDALDSPSRMARLAPATAARGAALAVVGGGLAALALAGAGPVPAAGGALALVLALALTLRPGDPGGPRHSVRRALAAPPGCVPEPAARTVARALVQAAAGVVLAAELTVLAHPWPVATAMPGAVLVALGVGDVRAAAAARAEERRSGRRVLVRVSWARGLLPVPGVRRVRPSDVFLERRAPALPALPPATRRPPVWLIGPGPSGADGVAEPPPRG